MIKSTLLKMTLLGSFVLGALGGSLFGFRAAAQGAGPAFSYFAYYIPMSIDPAKEMDKYGAQGWELVFVGTSEQLPSGPEGNALRETKRLMIFKKHS